MLCIYICVRMHIGFHFLGRRDGLPRFHLISLSVSISFFASQSILIKLERTFGVIRRVCVQVQVQSPKDLLATCRFSLPWPMFRVELH